MSTLETEVESAITDYLREPYTTRVDSADVDFLVGVVTHRCDDCTPMEARQTICEKLVLNGLLT